MPNLFQLRPKEALGVVLTTAILAAVSWATVKICGAVAKKRKQQTRTSRGLSRWLVPAITFVVQAIVLIFFVLWLRSLDNGPSPQILSQQLDLVERVVLANLADGKENLLEWILPDSRLMNKNSTADQMGNDAYVAWLGENGESKTSERNGMILRILRDLESEKLIKALATKTSKDGKIQVDAYIFPKGCDVLKNLRKDGCKITKYRGIN